MKTQVIRRRMHYGFAAVFAVMIPVALLTPLKKSVPFLVSLSLWALVASHWAAAESSTPEEEEE